ncbi:MAG TPA: LLM class flavin-dependent oxidoreductase [Acidimicrobiales bacterium]|nr:LLM class flavin-dependent oxidoreductase [Acidimicrobiales bacterium]
MAELRPNRPLSPGSISLRLYPHTGLGPEEMVHELRHQGALAVHAGFDGVMTSEHHGGFEGYIPNPLQAAGWLLESMDSGWAAPCPLLLTLRPPALVAEEVAWLAARFPGRVGLGVAAGSLPGDFAVMGLTDLDRTARFASGLRQVAGALSGTDAGLLSGDPAIARCARDPVPVVSAAMSTAAVQRAAGLDVGLLFDSLSAPERIRALTDAYRHAGGNRPCVLVRRVWLGEPPRDQVDRQLERYRSYAAPGAQAHWRGEHMVTSPDAAALAADLEDVARAAGVDALNLRVHVPGVAPATTREQIAAMGDVVAALHRSWSTQTAPHPSP